MMIQMKSHSVMHTESQTQTSNWQWTSQKTICLLAVMRGTPGCSDISLTQLLLVCISFNPLSSFRHAPIQLSLHSSVFSLFLFSESFFKHAYPTNKSHHNNLDKSHKQFSAVLLHRLFDFLSFDSVFVSKPIILSLSMPLKDT